MKNTGFEAGQFAAKQVVDLLTQQRDLYWQLSRMSAQQRSLITGNDPEWLLTLLADRQQLIDKLQAVGERLRPQQANWRQVRQGMDPDEGRRVDGLVAEINSLLAEILKQDETDTALLSARKGETQRAMGAISAGRQAGRAYAAAAQSQGIDWAQA